MKAKLCNDCPICVAWLEESVRQAMYGGQPSESNPDVSSPVDPEEYVRQVMFGPKAGQGDFGMIANVDIREEQVRQAMFGYARNEKGEEVQLEELMAQGGVQQPERCPRCHCVLT